MGYPANTTLECLTSVYSQQPFSLNIWYDQVVYFPFIGAGSFNEYRSIEIALLFGSTVTCFMSIYYLIFKILKRSHDYLSYLVLIWQFYVGLSLILTTTTYYSTATTSTQLVHIFFEIVLIVFLGFTNWSPFGTWGQINRIGWTLALSLFAYFQLFHSTANLSIQMNLSVWAILTDIIHPIMAGFHAVKTKNRIHLVLTIVHWLSFYPTIPFCWMPYATGVYTTVWVYLNLFPLILYILKDDQHPLELISQA